MNIINGWLEVGINNKDNRAILNVLVCEFGGAIEKKYGKLFYRAISHQCYDLNALYTKRLAQAQEKKELYAQHTK
jgi:hypothetical protein